MEISDVDIPFKSKTLIEIKIPGSKHETSDYFYQVLMHQTLCYGLSWTLIKTLKTMVQ